MSVNFGFCAVVVNATLVKSQCLVSESMERPEGWPVGFSTPGQSCLCLP